VARCYAQRSTLAEHHDQPTSCLKRDWGHSSGYKGSDAAFVHIGFPDCSVNKGSLVLVITSLAKIAVPNVADLMSHQGYTLLETKGNHRMVSIGKEASRKCLYSMTEPGILATRGVINKVTTKYRADGSNLGYFLVYH
jgi:hypothetical protein